MWCCSRTRRDGTDYLRRIVGLPGDRVQLKAGLLYVNGEMMLRQPAGDFPDQVNGVTVMVLKRYLEQLPDGPQHSIAKSTDEGRFNNTDEYLVPPGNVFALGVNRDNPVDSRLLNRVGYIPIQNLVWHAGTIYWSRRITRLFSKIE